MALNLARFNWTRLPEFAQDLNDGVFLGPFSTANSGDGNDVVSGRGFQGFNGLDAGIASASGRNGFAGGDGVSIRLGSRLFLGSGSNSLIGRGGSGGSGGNGAAGLFGPNSGSPATAGGAGGNGAAGGAGVFNAGMIDATQFLARTSTPRLRAGSGPSTVPGGINLVADGGRGGDGGNGGEGGDQAGVNVTPAGFGGQGGQAGAGGVGLENTSSGSIMGGALANVIVATGGRGGKGGNGGAAGNDVSQAGDGGNGGAGGLGGDGGDGVANAGLIMTGSAGDLIRGVGGDGGKGGNGTNGGIDLDSFPGEKGGDGGDGGDGGNGGAGIRNAFEGRILTGDGADVITGIGGTGGDGGSAGIGGPGNSNGLNGIAGNGGTNGYGIVNDGLIDMGKGKDVLDASRGGFSGNGLALLGDDDDTVRGFGSGQFDGGLGSADRLVFGAGTYVVTAGMNGFFNVTSGGVTMEVKGFEFINSLSNPFYNQAFGIGTFNVLA